MGTVIGEGMDDLEALARIEAPNLPDEFQIFAVEFFGATLGHVGARSSELRETSPENAADRCQPRNFEKNQGIGACQAQMQ